jgi:hypothetical protein
MRKKKMLLLAALGLLLAAGALTGLILMVKHVPAFYHRADVAPGKDRQERSKACFGRLVRLANYWDESRGEWDVTFSEAQINSYFEEDFSKSHGLAEVLGKQGISNPRIVLENDKLRLAFSYGEGLWSTVISYDLKMWLAPKDVNVVCVEILGRHAGALPISTQSLLNEISDVAARRGADITWYRHEGNPVALVRIQSDRARPSAVLRRLEIKQGVISIGGLSTEPQLSTHLKKALTPMAN